jgi:hypothetical protein
MKVDGQCHCGAITFEAEVDPERVYVCHCTDCQSISGSPFRWATNVPKGDFRLLSGSPKTYVKQAESGDENHQVFCPDCASPIYSTSSRDDWKSFNVRLGTVRQRAQLQPKLQLWHRSAQAWTGTLGQVEVMEKQ